jgi:hypothetical protein
MFKTPENLGPACPGAANRAATAAVLVPLAAASAGAAYAALHAGKWQVAAPLVIACCGFGVTSLLLYLQPSQLGRGQVQSRHAAGNQRIYSAITSLCIASSFAMFACALWLAQWLSHQDMPKWWSFPVFLLAAPPITTVLAYWLLKHCFAMKDQTVGAAIPPSSVADHVRDADERD